MSQISIGDLRGIEYGREGATINGTNPLGSFSLIDPPAFFGCLVERLRSNKPMPSLMWNMKSSNYAGLYIDVDTYVDAGMLFTSKIVKNYKDMLSGVANYFIEILRNGSATKADQIKDEIQYHPSLDDNKVNVMITVNHKYLKLIGTDDDKKELLEYAEAPSDEYPNGRIKIGAHIYLIPCIAIQRSQYPYKEIELSEIMNLDLIDGVDGTIDTRPNKSSVTIPGCTAHVDKDRYIFLTYDTSWYGCSSDDFEYKHELSKLQGDIEAIPSVDAMLSLSMVHPDCRRETYLMQEYESYIYSMAKDMTRQHICVDIGDYKDVKSKFEQVMSIDDITSIVTSTPELQQLSGNMLSSNILACLALTRVYKNGAFYEERSNRFHLRVALVGHVNGDVAHLDYLINIMKWVYSLSSQLMYRDIGEIRRNMISDFSSYSNRVHAGQHVKTIKSVLRDFITFTENDPSIVAIVNKMTNLTDIIPNIELRIVKIAEVFTIERLAGFVLDHTKNNPIVFCPAKQSYYIYNSEDFMFKYRKLIINKTQDQLSDYIRCLRRKIQSITVPFIESHNGGPNKIVVDFDKAELNPHELYKLKMFRRFNDLLESKLTLLIDECKALIREQSKNIQRIIKMYSGAQHTNLGIMDSIPDITGVYNGIIRLNLNRDGQYNIDFIDDIAIARDMYVSRTLNFSLNPDFDIYNNEIVNDINTILGQILEYPEFLLRVLAVTIFAPTTGAKAKLCEFWRGLGSNGKTILLKLISAFTNAEAAKLSQNYGATAGAEMLMHRQNKASHSEGIVHIDDARVLMLQEPPQTTDELNNTVIELDGQMIKKLIDGDGYFHGREIYGEDKMIRSSPHLLLAFNPQVKLDGTTNGMWRRFTARLFKSVFKDPNTCDPGLFDEPRTYPADPTLTKRILSQEYVTAFGHMLFFKFKEYVECGCDNAYFAPPNDLLQNQNQAIVTTPLMRICKEAIEYDAEAEPIRYDELLSLISTACTEAGQRVSFDTIKDTISHYQTKLKFNKDGNRIGRGEIFKPVGIEVEFCKYNLEKAQNIVLEFTG